MSFPWCRALPDQQNSTINPATACQSTTGSSQSTHCICQSTTCRGHQDVSKPIPKPLRMDRDRSSSGSGNHHPAPAMLWQQWNARAGKPATQLHRSTRRGFQLGPQPIRDAHHRITGHSGGFQRYASGCAPAGGVRPMGRSRRYAYPAKQPTKHTAPHRGCQTEARSHAPFADFSHPQTSPVCVIALRPGPQLRA